MSGDGIYGIFNKNNIGAAQKNPCKAMQDGLTIIRQLSSRADDSHAGVSTSKIRENYVSGAELGVSKDLLARKRTASAANTLLCKSRRRCHTCLSQFLTGRE